jgi:hypothetical protein
MIEQGSQSARPFDSLGELFHFPMCQLPPPRTNRRVIPQPAEKGFYFPKRKSHLTGEPDQQHPMNSFVRITPLPSSPLRRREQPQPFVVPDRRSIHPSPPSQFPNLHFFSPHVFVKNNALT